MRLHDKITVITGAAAGIGLAAAKLFVAEGATVVMVDLNAQQLAAAAQAIASPRVSHLVANVADVEQMRGVIESTVRQFGRLDVFVANAGIEGTVKDFADYPVEIFDRVISVNVRGAFIGVQAALKAMQPTGGSIIITASGAATQGAPGMAAYIASKHAVAGLMKVAALDGAKYGVRVNTVNPGPVETRMIQSLMEAAAPGHADAARKASAARIPLGRLALPEDVARTMLFLASDDSTYCSGGMYPVDGGLSAS
jgi:NAD(P)-dependent dehydrogenase (short-subunit alcohol dehydrogenase family)